MKTIWKLTIEYDPKNKPMFSAGLIFVPKPEDVEELSRLVDIPPVKSPSTPRRVLRLELNEADPKLSLILRGIEQKYGHQPAPWIITPPEMRDRFYSVRKTREYTEKDLDDAPLLYIASTAHSIARHTDGTDEQVEKEIYVAERDNRQYTNTQLGFLTPFHGLCVTESLGRQLEKAGVRGLSLEPVLILPEGKTRKPLLKLSSSCVAPRSLLPVVNEQGHQIEPNTNWSCYLDDGGYHPHEFKYRKEELKWFQKVDIAMSYERTGVTKARAYRWCLVSQRFRQVLAELKVRGTLYAPVRFVD